MPKNDIGGFFVSLGLNIDKDSFETGNRLIDGVGNSFNKLIGSARNAAVVLAGTAIATGAVESQAGKLASEIGISTDELGALLGKTYTPAAIALCDEGFAKEIEKLS